MEYRTEVTITANTNTSSKLDVEQNTSLPVHSNATMEAPTGTESYRQIQPSFLGTMETGTTQINGKNIGRRKNSGHATRHSEPIRRKYNIPPGQAAPFPENQEFVHILSS